MALEEEDLGLKRLFDDDEYVFYEEDDLGLERLFGQ